MTVKWRRFNNAIHRDIGYFFFGMTVIYGLSGIALNHIDDWDPSYIINRKEVVFESGPSMASLSKADLLGLLKEAGVHDAYKKHYYPEPGMLKVFLEGGSVMIDIARGVGILETVKRRPVFFDVNYLHYNNPKALWTWFSDVYAGALILMAITGLFVLKGKNSFRKRGIWFVIVGVVIPLVFLVFYYSSL